MGFLDFNVAEITSRIVRAFAVRGPVKATMDNGVIPVALAYDLTRAPFRLDEQKYFAGIMTPAFNAADGHGMAIINNTRLPLIVEWYRVQNRTGAICRVQASVIDVSAVTVGLAAINDQPFMGLENGRPGAMPGNNFVVRNDIIMRSFHMAGVVYPQQSPFTDQFDLPSNAAPPSWCLSSPNLDLVVPPGQALSFAATPVGVSFGMTAQVRVINNASIQS